MRQTDRSGVFRGIEGGPDAAARRDRSTCDCGSRNGRSKGNC